LVTHFHIPFGFVPTSTWATFNRCFDCPSLHVWGEEIPSADLDADHSNTHDQVFPFSQADGVGLDVAVDDVYGDFELIRSIGVELVNSGVFAILDA
jgi:hypothetical protein